jgi:hypothetical protein
MEGAKKKNNVMMEKMTHLLFLFRVCEGDINSIRWIDGNDTSSKLAIDINKSITFTFTCIIFNFIRNHGGKW